MHSVSTRNATNRTTASCEPLNDYSLGTAHLTPSTGNEGVSLPTPLTDMNVHLFVPHHLPQLLAVVNAQNSVTAEKMDSADNINA